MLVAKFSSILFTALALVPSGAHLMQVANKIDVPAQTYLIMQQTYRGWSLAGVLVVGALISTLALVLGLRKRTGFVAALTAFLAIAATQLVFWIFTYPTNEATNNWTMLPHNWEAMRLQWEASHAASAVLNITALVAAIVAVLRAEEGP